MLRKFDVMDSIFQFVVCSVMLFICDHVT